MFVTAAEEGTCYPGSGGESCKAPAATDRASEGGIGSLFGGFSFESLTGLFGGGGESSYPIPSHPIPSFYVFQCHGTVGTHNTASVPRGSHFGLSPLHSRLHLCVRPFHRKAPAESLEAPPVTLSVGASRPPGPVQAGLLVSAALPTILLGDCLCISGGARPPQSIAVRSIVWFRRIVRLFSMPPNMTSIVQTGAPVILAATDARPSTNRNQAGSASDVVSLPQDPKANTAGRKRQLAEKQKDYTWRMGVR